MIKVVFLPKRNSPVNLKPVEYFVLTDNYKVAYEKALEQLPVDVKKECIHYYNNYAACEVNLIK